MNTRRKDKNGKFSQHHAIGFDNLDKLIWHVENLFNSDSGYEGWTTIQAISQVDHQKRHEKRPKALLIRNKKTGKLNAYTRELAI